MRKLVALLLVIGACRVAAGQVADGYLETWLTTRTRQLDARMSERTFDSVGWANTIQGALDLAKQHARPVFLFTLDGHMDSGRC